MSCLQNVRAVRSLFIVCIAIPVASCGMFFGQRSSISDSSPFEDYFNKPTAEQYIGGPAYEGLTESIGTMKSTTIARGISEIDRVLDSTAEPQNLLKKDEAIFLLRIISGRPDGPELLASQLDRLASMLNDPSHTLSAPALLVLQALGYRRPDMVWPILEAALKAPEVNNSSGLGPGIATILLRMGPHGEDVTEHVAEYMRRPDLTEKQQIDTIIGVANSALIPEVLATELVHYLDLPSESVKMRVLVALSRSNQEAKNAVRARIQRMANDPRESVRIRRSASESLQGPITENPDSK